jgi:hypothetical protein
MKNICDVSCASETLVIRQTKGLSSN